MLFVSTLSCMKCIWVHHLAENTDYHFSTPHTITYLAALLAPNDHNFHLVVSEHRHGRTLRGNQVTSGELVTTWKLMGHIFISSYTFSKIPMVSGIWLIALLIAWLIAFMDSGSVSLKVFLKSVFIYSSKKCRSLNELPYTYIFNWLVIHWLGLITTFYGSLYISSYICHSAKIRF